MVTDHTLVCVLLIFYIFYTSVNEESAMCVFLINMHPRPHVEHREYICLPFVGWVLGSKGTTVEPSEQGGHCGLSCERCPPSPSGFTS